MRKFLLVSGLVLWVAVGWGVTMTAGLDVKALSERADVIMVGKCVAKQSYWSQGHIETRYEFESEEYLKGDLGKRWAMTLMGGEIREPWPLGQKVVGMPEFFKDEEVVLFLYRPGRFMPAGGEGAQFKISVAMRSSPMVVGLQQGKFQIIRDPKTGERKVFGPGMKAPERMAHSRDLQKLEAVKGEGQVKAKKVGGDGSGSELEMLSFKPSKKDGLKGIDVSGLRSLDNFKSQVKSNLSGSPE